MAGPAQVLQSIDGLYDEVRGFDGQALTYRPDIPPEMNTLRSMDGYSGYWIRMLEDAVLTMTGAPIPADTPIQLEPGWNLIAYLPSSSLSVESALRSIEGLYEELHGFSGQALSYYAALPPAMNSLQVMQPHQGYWIKMVQPATLVYPDAGS